jgi:ubiquinone/menaquinone biosynthesis C-methylase UbiE
VGAIKSIALRWAKPLHKKLRDQKLDLFFQLTGEHPSGTLLDVGGGPGIAGEFLRLYASFAETTIVNLEPLQLEQEMQGRIHTLVANGLDLPFASGAFDWVFSNAVIEHVGGWERQKLFAQEVRRVAANGYFVATPNRYFPLEPHTLLPLYQFFPSGLQRRVVRFSPGYLKEYEQIDLLSAKQMRMLFPGATVKTMGFPIWGNSLVAYYSAAHQ